MPQGFLTAAAAVINTLFLVAGAYIYLSLGRQIAGRVADSEPSDPVRRTFGWPDVVLVCIIMGLFLWNALSSVGVSGKMVLRTNDLIANALVSAALFVFVAAFVNIRGISVSALAGWARVSFGRAVLTGTVLLFAAYPLIFVADLLSQRVLGGNSSRQGIVEMFADSQTLQQRVLIIVLAVMVAPIVEEFVFRFFVYGVVKRYLGRFVGLLVNSLLFAAVHAHLPSAGPLFVLAACFTLAYEWSGSILVNMTMHALFNAVTLTALAFPDLFRQ
ncbi:MAG: CPBP family intramembrane metalloprotease [Verrucomicrobiota bacterium]|nr:CPBP family intramembrane metalloprotease [Verrucomicrobiota bacterium]